MKRDAHVLGHPWSMYDIESTSESSNEFATAKLSLLIRYRQHVDPPPAAIELHDAVDQCEQREIFPLPHAASRVERIADLPNQNIARHNRFTGKPLHTAALTGRITSVAARALTFLMCHGKNYGLETGNERLRPETPPTDASTRPAVRS